MTYLLLQTFLLLLASYFTGAFLACLIKRTLKTTRAAYVAAEPVTVRPLPAPIPVRTPAPPPKFKSREFELVQPKIDILPRPEPRPAPAPLDTERFERTLVHAVLPDNTPRKMIVEIRPQVLKPVTARGPGADIAKPAPKPAPVPVSMPVAPKPAAVPPPAPAHTSTPIVSKGPPQSSTPIAGGAASATAAAAAAALAAARAAADRAATQPPAAAVDRTPPAGPVSSQPPAPKPTEPVVPPITDGDDFLRIRAIDVPLMQRLHGLGITTFENIAGWTPADAERFGKELGIGGRIEREQWIEQAQILAKGGETYYSRNRAALLQQQAASSPSPQPVPAAEPRAEQPKAGTAQQASSYTSAGLMSAAAAAAAAATTLQKKPEQVEAKSVLPQSAAQQAPEPEDQLQAEEELVEDADQTSLEEAVEPDGQADDQQEIEDEPESAEEESAQPEPSLNMSSPQTPEPPPAASLQERLSTADAEPGRSPPPQRSVAEMAAAAAAAMAAASASVTRGIRPIEPISPLSKVDPNILRPARLVDAIKEQESKDSEGREAERAALDGLRSIRSDALLSDGAPEEFDDLKRIRGIGVLIEKRLNALGIASYEQIANWTAGDIERISEQLDFKGRIERENWVEQARILASGGHTEFSRRVDKGDVDSSKG
ncbi:MAG: hypothetical protein AB7S74_02015 [Hyphomicrobium sp.]